MNVVLLGFGTLALGLLEGLLESINCQVVGVYPWSCAEKSNPYQNQDEKMFLALIEQYGLLKIKARSVNSYEFIEQVRQLDTDLILIGSWGEKISPHVVHIDGVQVINCHPSLLPKHRGANPYISIIRENEQEGGITFHQVTENIDEGPVLLQEAVEVSVTETGGSLKTKCGLLAKVSVGELIQGLVNRTIQPAPQNEAKSTYYPPIGIEDGAIDWNKDPEEIERLLRALTPWVKGYGYIDGKWMLRFTALRLNEKQHQSEPGTVLGVLNNGAIQVSSSDKVRVFEIYDYQIHNRVIFLPTILSRQWAKIFVKPKQRITPE